MCSMKMYEDLNINTNSAFFKKYYKAGLLNNVDSDFSKETRQYWQDHYNKDIDPVTQMIFMNLTNKKEVRVVPGNLLRKEIFPTFNDYNTTGYYGDKNIYGKYIKYPDAPKAYLRKIGGNFFDDEYNQISYKQAKELLLNLDFEVIIKLTKANNGRGVSKIKIENNNIISDKEILDFDGFLKKYSGDFIIQEVIQQHPNMAAPHPSSVNTIRIVTFRWKGQIRYLLSFARFGMNNDIRDNSSVDISPALGVHENGEFYKVGLNKNGDVLTHHPTTNYCFADLKPIDNFEDFKETVIKYHEEFIHVDIVAWDIAVGVNGNPIILECNFAGDTAFYQLVTEKPFFGDLTEEVLKHTLNEWKYRKPALMRKDRKPAVRIRKLKRRIKHLENQVNKIK